MERTYENEQAPKSDNKRIVIGLVLLTLAGLLFADNFDLLPWNWEHFVFSWQMILIVIGLILFAKNKSQSTGIILMAIGGFFLAAKLLNYYYEIHHLMLPIILAIIGVLFIVRKGNQHLISGREK